MCIRDRPLHDALFPLPLTSFPHFFLFTFETVVALMKQTMRLPLLCSPPFSSLGRPRRSACRCGGERGLTRIFRAKRRLVSCAFMTRREIQTTHRTAPAGQEREGGREGRRTSLTDLYRLRDRNSDALHSFMCVVVCLGPFYFFFSRRNCFYAPPFHSIPVLPPLCVISGKGKKTHDAENINERRRRGTARAAA